LLFNSTVSVLPAQIATPHCKKSDCQIRSFQEISGISVAKPEWPQNANEIAAGRKSATASKENCHSPSQTMVTDLPLSL
jgi:hypothetical protein